jgi:hypothetical protein
MRETSRRDLLPVPRRRHDHKQNITNAPNTPRIYYYRSRLASPNAHESSPLTQHITQNSIITPNSLITPNTHTTPPNTDHSVPSEAIHSNFEQKGMPSLSNNEPPMQIHTQTLTKPSLFYAESNSPRLHLIISAVIIILFFLFLYYTRPSE